MKIRISFILAVLSGMCFGQIPILNSHPSNTTQVLYLDFDGQTVSGTFWDSGNTINALPSTMSASNITVIFKRVSEDFMPFEVNVTTDENNFNNAPANSRMRIIITPSSAWYGSAGGVAYVNSFTWGGTPGTPCWVFENLLSYSAKNIAEAASHEAGHTLSLRHQSTYSYTPSSCTKTAEYNPGQGTGVTSWAPIMGVGYSRNVTVWHNGTSTSNCNTIQYDHSSSNNGIRKNGFLTFRADDVGNTSATGKILNLNTVLTVDSGLITEPTDLDVYKFTICNNRYVTIDVKPWALDTVGYQGANLDIRLHVYNSNNLQLAVDTPLANLNARIGLNLTAGSYWFSIDGGSSANYSDYGSLGRYYIRVKATNPPLLTNTIVVPNPFCADQFVPLTYTSNGTSTQWQWNVYGANSASYTIQNPNVNLSAGIHTIQLQSSSSNSISCVTTRTVNVLISPIVLINTTANDLCAGSSVTISALGASSYTWLPGAVNGSMQIFTPTVNSTYTIVGSNGSCTNSALSFVNVSPRFTISALAINDSICQGESTTLIGSGASAYVFNPGNISGNSVAVSPTLTTTYTITGTVTNNLCSDSTTVTVALRDCDVLGINTLPGTDYGIKIYPNPSHDYLIIETISTGQVLEVYNVLGQRLMIQNMDTSSLRIKTDVWSRGIYFVKLLSGDKAIRSEKVIIE